MATIDGVRSKINDTANRLKVLMAVPVKTETDWQMVDELKDHLKGLYENLGELMREQRPPKDDF